MRFRLLEKKIAGKSDLALPEEDQQDLNNSVFVKELACRSTHENVTENICYWY